jgi:hypothetical protein
MDYIAQFEPTSCSIIVPELISSSIDPTEALVLGVSARPIQTQFSDGILLFVSAIYVLYTVSAKAYRWACELRSVGAIASLYVVFDDLHANQRKRMLSLDGLALFAAD